MVFLKSTIFHSIVLATLKKRMSELMSFMSDTLFKIVQSWAYTEGNVNTTDELLKWIDDLNCTIEVSIQKITLEESGVWYYHTTEGCIENQNKSFFSIRGIQKILKDQLLFEQPIIVQSEIGYLGIICKEINGVLNFLMQAKIEPGNVNKVQISPTLQATRSNFTQRHGGNKPEYLDYFLNAQDHEVVVDQIQSEQSSRFYKKRNRNIIIRVDTEIPLSYNYRWMTLGQMKKLMKYNNLVNMDTRTVLSCIPYHLGDYTAEEFHQLEDLFKDNSLFRSVFIGDKTNMLPTIYQYINNYKMFDESQTRLVPLSLLSSWEMREGAFFSRNPYGFKIIFCDITIEGREVRHWTQPMFEAIGMATFGLICTTIDGVKKFLIRALPEAGSFDKLEIGPSVQLEAAAGLESYDTIVQLFMDRLLMNHHVIHNVILSEEGGRFYHEQNYNIILEVEEEALSNLPSGYFLVDYRTLNMLIQVNNCLNIQLRNLLSLLEV